MYKSKPIIFSLIWIALGCVEQASTPPIDVFAPRLTAIFVAELDASVSWYREKLGFEIEKESEEYPDYGLKVAFLTLNGFHLEIIEKANSFKQSDILLEEDQYVGGIFKIGLKSSDLDSLFTRLKDLGGVEFLTGIGELPESQLPIEWPTQYFLIKDPDGNFIQFFDSGETMEGSPWLFMVTIENIEKGISWYSDKLGFKHLQTVGEEGNRRAVLERNNYILELFEPHKVRKANEVSADSAILGFAKLAFAVEDLTLLSANWEKDSIEIVTPIEKIDFEWAEKAMIIKDPEGNWVQLFETEE